MTKEKKISLTKHKDRLSDALRGPIPSKHLKHPKEYKQFIERELAAVTAKLKEEAAA